MTPLPPIRIHNPNHELYVYWLITDWCNQQCSYCPSLLHEGDYHRGRKPGFPDQSRLMAFCDRVTALASAHSRRLRVTLTGGEPTIHPDFDLVMSRLQGRAWLEVITNGTRSSHWWSQLAALPDRVVISLHPQYYDRRVEKINDLTAWLVDRGVTVVYNLIADPEQWHMVEKMHEDLAPEYRPWVIPKVVQDLTDLRARPRVAYTAQQLAWIKQYPTRVASIFTENPQVQRQDGSLEPIRPHQLIADNQHRFRGWRCAAGVTSINVDWQGRVTAGICQSQLLGDLETFDLRSRYIQCPKAECTCPGDIVLDKYQARRSTEGVLDSSS